VERTLGAGTFSTVWLARDEDLDAWVAIKLLAENWSLNQDARRRFIEEARALRRLDNDRIVRVYEVGRLPDGRPYMVMEFADRGTLEDRMRLRASLNQPYSVHEAVAASLEIAECLIAVHDLSIVHRDVKPSNVLFRSVPRERQDAMRRDGKPVAAERTLLGDFGIARKLEGFPGQTMVVGSPHYMAPEQADPARAHLVDYRSDLYSAAAILYELLAGRLPFGFRSLTEIQGAPHDTAPAPIQDLQPAVSSSLAKVVHQGLERDPDRRLATAREWRDALRGLLGEDHAPVSVSTRAGAEADRGVAVRTVPIALAEPPRPGGYASSPQAARHGAPPGRRTYRRSRSIGTRSRAG
jgi:serine/threonine protein kinase